MRFYFNDLSIAGQFADAAAFCRELDILLKVRERSGWVRARLLCSKALKDRPATPTQPFREAVQSNGNKDLLRRVLGWVGQTGPFWEDDRATNPDDLFYFDGQDVTYQGLGEAARRRLQAADDASFGLNGSRHPCDFDELKVQHGLLENPLGLVPVPNFPGVEKLLSAVSIALPPPQSWTDLLERVEVRYDAVLPGRNIGEMLRPHPFSEYVSERVLELLGVLQAFVRSRDEHGGYTERSHEILSTFFSGRTARFTDESDSNKRRFRRELTFEDPESRELSLFCPFHGKINTPPYRIHFAWPIGPHEKRVKVVYIGPKITK